MILSLNEDDTVSTRAIILTICPYGPINERRRYGINMKHIITSFPFFKMVQKSRIKSFVPTHFIYGMIFQVWSEAELKSMAYVAGQPRPHYIMTLYGIV